MKKTLTPLLALMLGVLALPSCTSNNVPSSFDVETVFGKIGYNINKYRENDLTPKQLVEKANVSGLKKNYTQRDVLALLKAGFEDIMPSLEGYRKTNGIFMPSDGIYDEYQNWFNSYGLWGNTTYGAGLKAEDDFVDLMLNRIHTYFGTSPVDDYCGYVNKEYLDSYVPYNENSYYDSHLIDSNIVYSKIVSIMNSAIEDTDKSNAYKLFDYYEDLIGNLGMYTQFEDDNSPYVDSFITSVDSVSTMSEYVTFERSNFLTRGRCAFFNIDTSEMEVGYGEGYSYITYYNANAGMDVASFRASYISAKPAEYVENKCHTESFSALGLSQTEIDRINSGLVEFFTGLKTELTAISEQTTKPKEFYTDYYDDPLEGTDLSLKSLLRAANYDKMLFRVSRDNSYLLSAYKRMLSNPSYLNGLKAFSKYQFLASKGIQEDAGRCSEYIGYFYQQSLYSNLLMDYYSKTEEYVQAVNKTNELINDYIIPAFKNNFVENGWLSEEGIRIVNEKIDAITMNAYVDINNIGRTDAEPFYRNINYSEDLLSVSDQIYKAHLDYMMHYMTADGAGFSEQYYLSSNPLTENAYYLPYANSINLYGGFLLSVPPVATLDDESLLAEYGTVVAHEISHGFDNTGIYFGKDGSYTGRPIIPTSDISKYKILQDKVKKLYNSLEVYSGIATSGKTVLGEAIADIGAVNVCHTALMQHKNSEADEEKFFNLFAYKFFSIYSPSVYKESQVGTDSHPVGKPRSNGPLKCNSAFQRVVGTQQGDGMYMSSDDCITIW